VRGETNFKKFINFQRVYSGIFGYVRVCSGIFRKVCHFQLMRIIRVLMMKKEILLFSVSLFVTCNLFAQLPDSSSSVIRVLSFNIFHGATTLKDYNTDTIAAVIKAADPDFVALQEVDYRTVRNGKRDLATELGYRVNMIPLFGRSMYFNEGEYGLAILSKQTIIRSELVALPGTPGREPRTALSIISVLPSGDTVRFISTHLDHQLEDDRVAQAKRINDFFTHSPYPAIIAGDFNAIPDSPTIKIMEEKWLPAYSLNNADPTFPSSAPEIKIDYVMSYPKERWLPLNSEVIHSTIASDHCALLVTLRLIKLSPL